MIKIFNKTLEINEINRFIEMIQEGKEYVGTKEEEMYFDVLLNQIKIHYIIDLDFNEHVSKKGMNYLFDLVANHNFIINQVDGGLERFVVDLYEVFVKNGFRD